MQQNLYAKHFVILLCCDNPTRMSTIWNPKSSKFNDWLDELGIPSGVVGKCKSRTGLQVDIDTLVEVGLLEVVDRYYYVLTENGHNFVKNNAKNIPRQWKMYNNMPLVVATIPKWTKQ